MAKVRAGVIGAGYLGRYHAQKYAAMPNVELVGVVDLDAAKARQVAEEYLEPFKRAGVDALVLGCTHYPLLRVTLGALGKEHRGRSGGPVSSCQSASPRPVAASTSQARCTRARFCRSIRAPVSASSSASISLSDSASARWRSSGGVGGISVYRRRNG